jgi:hypothetical protein
VPLRFRLLFRRLLSILLLTFHIAVARSPALASCFPSLVDRPLVRMAFLVGSLAALACNTSLFLWIHRCESTSSFLHVASSGTPARLVMQKQSQITPHVAGNQKVLANVLVTLLAQLLGERGV